MGIIRIGDAAPSLLRLGDVDAYEARAGEERVWPGNETRLWLHLTSNLQVTVYYGGKSGLGWIIHWGDGQASRPSSAYYSSHTYAGPGDYLVRIETDRAETRALGYPGNAYNIMGAAVSEDKNETSPALVRAEVGGWAARISTYTFTNCTSLSTVDVGCGVDLIGNNSFSGCAGLVLAELGARRLGNSILSNCPRLQKLWLRESVKTLGAASLAGIGPTGAFTIYCEADEKPDTWPSGWNADGHAVVWGQKARPW